LTPGILTFDDLREISRLGPRARLARMERWANTNGIRYKYDGRGGIWTTVEAINAALGVSAAVDADSDMLTVDKVF